ncbi:MULTISPECIES: hypothetical protein [Actinoalloteichus]|uniref:hypothetical protein n=1 Tax=Actinoalloteichus TaxID=65496 RepID=UPI000AFDE73D|nr:hypothetical protein [Actinoalloteichus caeruleus]
MGQVRAGGVIIANLGYALARLTITEDGGASGPFTDHAAFMRMRSDPHHTSATGRDIIEMASGRGTSATHPFPDFLDERPLECLRVLTDPDVVKVVRHHDHGVVHVLGDPASRSWARARRTSPGHATVVHSGPRNLWAEYVRLAEFWDDHGRPPPTRLGLTVRPDGQHVLWLDRPERPIAELP